MTDYTPEAIEADVAKVRGVTWTRGRQWTASDVDALERLLSLAERVAKSPRGTPVALTSGANGADGFLRVERSLGVIYPMGQLCALVNLEQQP